VKLKYIYARLNIASIVLNAVVALSRLSHMLCFVQTAFAEWVWTVTHHDKWDIFPLLWFHREMCSKECCLLGCDIVLVGRNLPTYVRNVLLHPHYSKLSMGASGFFKTFIIFYQTTQCHIPQNCVLNSQSLNSLACLHCLLLIFSP
jgi:ABC-type Fe3+-siderophore transport system permease subunit